LEAETLEEHEMNQQDMQIGFEDPTEQISLKFYSTRNTQSDMRNTS